MISRLRHLTLASVSCLATLTVGAAEPTAEQTLYWWQDELRTVAANLSTLRTGKVAQWPRMTVPAGAATLPLPLIAASEGTANAGATRFPVGPLFDDWSAGPFWIEVRACRRAKDLHLAIHSPRSLAELRSLSADGELFTLNETPYHVGKRGLPEKANGGEFVVELTVPLEGAATLSFPVELLRRPEGKLPDAARSLGIDQLTAREAAGARARFRSPTLWLDPIRVRLIPAQVAVQIVPPAVRDEAAGYCWQVVKPDAKPETGVLSVKLAQASRVAWAAWEHTTGKQRWTLEEAIYLEPIPAMLEATAAMAARCRAVSTLPPPGTDAVTAEAGKASPADRVAWRALYTKVRALRSAVHLSMLDAPLLLVKQHPYYAAHIYDDFYPWHPGGGIYVLQQPHRMTAQRTVRAVIDPSTNQTLGEGVYRDPEISWDATRIVFANKQKADGPTSIYEIGLDGRNLRRLTAHEEHSDIQPAYLPDDRIVFISTRPRALVPCFNSGVGTLHTMNADGSNLRSISANNVTEFDPSVLPDGRILYGRWEYVDKTALYMQSLWAVTPDGRMEESLFKNNLPKPTAVLDPRPVPNSHRVVASLTPHNGQPAGAIATIDPRYGKNNLEPVINFTAEYPVEMDQGLATGACDPWPLSEDDVLLSNNAIGGHGVIELADRFGQRELVCCDGAISCYAPMLIKPRKRPPQIPPQHEPAASGSFLVSDVYEGLQDVPRGTVKRLRLVEETARTSGIPPGGRWWNQAFLISWQGAYIVKNILGTVPVYDDGSAYFEAPAGRAIYFEALDQNGREVQRMRTFVQAAPGTTRSCIGCHEHKESAPLRVAHSLEAMRHGSAKPEPESWGSGLIDYASNIQPILDKHCVRCHGGPEGIAKGLDFSGGWTWAFNISYETFIKNRMVGFLNCNNASVHTSMLLRPRSIGSGASPFADLMVARRGETKHFSQAERDVILAWMDTNSNYYGSWDYTKYATCDAILSASGRLSPAMREAGCTKCHPAGFIGNDWINLQTPEWSRILRAPLAKKKGTLGLAMCRQRKAQPGYPLVTQAVQPPDVLLPSKQPPYDPGGEVHVTFESSDDPRWQAMLGAIRQIRAEALARPRVDMPGAVIEGGVCRMQVPPPLPARPPAIQMQVTDDGGVEVRWARTAQTVGLEYELHRDDRPDFTPSPATQVGLTTAGRLLDLTATPGKNYYALVVTSVGRRTAPVYASVEVPDLPPPRTPPRPEARSLPGEIVIGWLPAENGVRLYDVYRAEADPQAFVKVTPQPLTMLVYSDTRVEAGRAYWYRVVAIDRRGQASQPSPAVEAGPRPQVREPIFTVLLDRKAEAKLLDGSVVAGQLRGGAKLADDALLTGQQGFLTFEHRNEFDLGPAFSFECRVRFEKESQMPVVAACGAFNHTGWFLQRYGRGWRWHLGGISCDGGVGVVGQWVHLVGTFDGREACLYQNGKQVGKAACDPNPAPFAGPLVIGQYASQAPSYQVQGQIKDVKIYRRALRGEEVRGK